MQPSLEHLGRFDPERSRQRLLNSFYPEHTQLILLQSKPVGFYTFRPVDDYLKLDHLYVRPAFQSQRIGAAIMALVIKQADQLQKPIHVCALQQSASNRFYQQHGFIPHREDDWNVYYRWSPQFPNLSD